MPFRRLQKPIFLMCSDRSGSHLVTKLFDARSDVCAPGTSHLFRVFAEVGACYRPGDPRFLSDLWSMFDAKIGSWLIDHLDGPARAALIPPGALPHQAIIALYEAEAEASGKSRVFVRENSIHGYIPFVESASQDASYLFVVRDPRDMAVSWLKAPVLRGGVVRAARRWREDQQGFLTAFAWLAPDHKMAFATYEALVSQPTATLTRICRTLGLGFEPAMLDFHLHSRSAREDAARAEVWGNLAHPLMAGNYNKFHSMLGDDELAYVEALCGPLMDVFGYARARPAGLAPFGTFNNFDELEKALTEREPWTKPEYAMLPTEERQRFEAWSALFQGLKQRAFVLNDEKHR